MTAPVVAESFIGNGKYRSASITQTGRTATCLPIAGFKCIKEYDDTENLEMCLERERMSKCGK